MTFSGEIPHGLKIINIVTILLSLAITEYAIFYGYTDSFDVSLFFDPFNLLWLTLPYIFLCVAVVRQPQERVSTTFFLSVVCFLLAFLYLNSISSPYRDDLTYVVVPLLQMTVIVLGYTVHGLWIKIFKKSVGEIK